MTRPRVPGAAGAILRTRSRGSTSVVDPRLLAIADDSRGVTLRVRVTARAKREGILGLHEGALRIAVRAVAERGQANRAVLEVLADRLGLPRSGLSIERGTARRDKTIRISGIDAAELRRRLELAALSGSSAAR